MASITEISFDLAAAMLDNSVNTLLNEGTGNAIINIYSGSLPANCEATATGTLLATCVMNAIPFGAATNLSPNARITANPVIDDPDAVAGGTATYFRAYSTNAGTDASKLYCHIQGSAGEAADSTDLTLDVKLVVLGQSVSVTAWSIDMIES